MVYINPGQLQLPIEYNFNQQVFCLNLYKLKPLNIYLTLLLLDDW